MIQVLCSAVQRFEFEIRGVAEFVRHAYSLLKFGRWERLGG